MKIDLPDADGSNVITLSVVRESRRLREIGGTRCSHMNVTTDTTLAELKCGDCGERLNPVEYLAGLAEEWHRIERLYFQYREAKAAYDAKGRCRCEHCGKLTRVKPASPAQVREWKKEQGL